MNGDTEVEEIEELFADLSNASGAALGDAGGVGRILADDNDSRDG